MPCSASSKRIVPELRVCGVDEAGRGPIAGPVFAAAVMLDPARPVAGIRDSKLLSARRRDSLAVEIRRCALGWAVAHATVQEIDALNILQAAMLAMRRAVEQLDPPPGLALIDGNRVPALACEAKAIVGGDRSHEAIGAASILAKTARDAEMRRLHHLHPVYGLDRHKGYPTAEHLRLLELHGACDIYRKTFAPVRRLLAP